jgi:hypothetical protein
MSKLKFILIVMCLSMIGVTIATSLKQSLFDVLPRMLHDPWTVATFVDFYFNIIIITSWVAYKEGSVLKTFAWFIAFVLLGSIATSFYVLLQIWKLEPGDTLNQLWGKNA